MGVQGLWKLLESTGRPVNLESLEGKILAVDVSIWLNQAVLGVHGNSLSNPHLQVLFNRICKLLFYRIKPVFVFDGIPPQLKKKTLAARRQRKENAAVKSEKAAEKIIKNYLKSRAVKAVMAETGKSTSKRTPTLRLPRKHEDDMFELPPLPSTSQDQSERSLSGDESADVMDAWAAQQSEWASSFQDMKEVNIESDTFQALPIEVQHELITDIQESSKRNSWSRMHQLPKESHAFSKYQMEKLLKKGRMSLRLDDLRKEMKMRMSHTMAKLLDAETQRSQVDAGRVASEDTQQYILVTRDKGEDAEEEKEDDAKATVTSYGQKAGFATSMDIQMEKAMRKRGSVATETRTASPSSSSSPSPSLSQIQSRGIVEASASSSSSSSLIVQAKRTDTLDIGNVASSSASSQSEVVEIIDLEDKSSATTDALQSTEHRAELDFGGERLKEGVARNDDDGAKNKKDALMEQLQKFFNNFDDNITSKNTEIPLRNTTAQEQNPTGDQESMCEEVVTVREESNKKTLSEEQYADEDSQNKSRDNSTLNAVQDDSIRDEEYKVGDDVTMATSDAIHISSDDEDNSRTAEEGAGSPHGDDVQISDAENNKSDILIELDFQEELMNSHNRKDAENKKHVTIEETELGLQDENIAGVESKLEENSFSVKKEDEDEDDFAYLTDPFHPSFREAHGSPVSRNMPLDDDDDGRQLQEAWRAAEKLQESDQEPDVDEWRGMDLDDMEGVNDDLENERHALETERRKQQKKATSVTDTMYAESKELLQCFGIPYIDSPQEAESQCAFLDLTNQTHGTITDDSDIWLFGGRRVYKSFFSKKRDPEFFMAADIEKHLLLSRSKLVNLAYLMGSDYTIGIQGVGYVSAMEVLSEFKGQGLDSLKAFKAWWNRTQDQLSPVESPVKAKLRKVTVPSDFPNPLVAQAYLSPVVDESRESFQWGQPDLGLLREFARERFGWMRGKVDETLLPVLKRLNETQVQSKMTSFFSVTGHSDKRKLASKRIKKVLKQMGKKNDGEEEDETEEETEEESEDSMSQKQKKIRKRKASKEDSDNEGRTKSVKRKRKVRKEDASVMNGKKGKRKRMTIGRARKEKKMLVTDSKGRIKLLTQAEEKDDSDSSDDGYSRQKKTNKNRSKKGLDAVGRRGKTQMEPDSDIEDDCDISDQELIEAAERLERSAAVGVGNGHGFTKGLRSMSTKSGPQEKTVESVDRRRTSTKKGKGKTPIVPEGNHRGRQSRKGKGAREGSMKGKTLAARKLAHVSGPNLSSSGSDSD